jgi:glycosyltransferase involved in cell wall biosynthesis
MTSGRLHRVRRARRSCCESIIPPLSEPARPRVSVVIPVYAADRELFRIALQSILAQTLRDFECLVVEDPSATSVSDILTEARDPRVIFHANVERTSQAAKYNWGLSRARGDYLARFDADDIAAPQRLERQIAFLEAHPDVDIVGSDVTLIDGRGNVIGVRRYPRAHDEIARAVKKFNPIANPSLMFRRRVFDESGGWTEQPIKPARDYDWISRMIRAGHRLANIDEQLVRYRIHGGGVKQKSLRGSIRATIEIKRTYWWKEMSLFDRILVVAEAMLTLMPSRLVLWLFLRLRTQRR